MLRFVGAQKVQIERYNNSLDHTHTLGESEVLKRSDAVRKLVEEEAAKNYPPPTIMSAIKDYATRKLDLGASVKELKRKEVSNIKQRVWEVQKNDNFGGNLDIESDIVECINFLNNEGWVFFIYIHWLGAKKRDDINKKNSSTKN